MRFGETSLCETKMSALGHGGAVVLKFTGLFHVELLSSISTVRFMCGFVSISKTAQRLFAALRCSYMFLSRERSFITCCLQGESHFLDSHSRLKQFKAVNFFVKSYDNKHQTVYNCKR